jgi:hypothetical protein
MISELRKKQIGGVLVGVGLLALVGYATSGRGEQQCRAWVQAEESGGAVALAQHADWLTDFVKSRIPTPEVAGQMAEILRPLIFSWCAHHPEAAVEMGLKEVVEEWNRHAAAIRGDDKPKPMDPATCAELWARASTEPTLAIPMSCPKPD